MNPQPSLAIFAGTHWIPTTVALTPAALTPQLAALWLEKTWWPSGEKVDAFARVMAEGRWRPGSIILFMEGLMADGHHRCAAVIAAGVTIEVQLGVVKGLNRGH